VGEDVNDLLYQFWVHTEQIGKLGWFDRVFCSPSNHRVHHAVNDPYLDKNYGGILVVWDRLFGTFREESEKCIYGTRGPLNSWDPVWANLEVYWDLLKDSWHTRSWTDKVRVWVKPPGWRPADVAARYPKPSFDMGQVTLYDPPAAATTHWAAVMQFAVLLAGVSCVLWFAAIWSTREIAVASMALLTAFWALGATLQGRIQVLEMLLIDAAILATATSALGLLTLHFVFKPLTMLIAIILIATRAHPSWASARFHHILLAAVTFSLAGDVFLMLPGNYFIPGLACFLVTHLLYLTLFRQGTHWFARRGALMSTLAVGCAMYAWVWGGLTGPVLKIAVAIYIVAIALMTAQAIGRAHDVRHPSSVWVAVGTCVFMLSDALIAINRFVQPVPLAALWVLSTYYLAQILIVHNARPVLTTARNTAAELYGNRSATASHASGAIRPS
jgi:alkylglycerol monooxygenase